MAKKNVIVGMSWEPPNTRAEQLADRDVNKAMRKEWDDRRNRTERPGFEKIQNMRYKGGK